MVFGGRRPPRPQNREILGLSEDVWMLVERCWDGDPAVRPLTADTLSFLETASSHWVPPTFEAIANLGLDRPITAQRPPTSDLTFTVSVTASGVMGPEAGCRDSLRSLAIASDVQQSTVGFYVSLPLSLHSNAFSSCRYPRVSTRLDPRCRLHSYWLFF